MHSEWVKTSREQGPLTRGSFSIATYSKASKARYVSPSILRSLEAHVLARIGHFAQAVGYELRAINESKTLHAGGEIRTENAASYLSKLPSKSSDLTREALGAGYICASCNFAVPVLHCIPLFAPELDAGHGQVHRLMGARPAPLPSAPALIRSLPGYGPLVRAAQSTSR